jgi:hypothetical protein
MSLEMSELNLHVAGTDLAPLIRDIVQEVINQFQEFHAKSGDKLCHTEEEAAILLGLKSHQLRDARLAGKIECCQLTGRRIRYTKEQLLDYLRANPWEPNR